MRKLKVSEHDLLFALENRVAGVTHYLDTETGDVVPVFTYNRELILAAVKENPSRYVRLAPQSGSQAYKAMIDFTRTVNRPDLRTKLEAALTQPSRFRLFRELLAEYQEEQARWRQFRGAAMLQALCDRLRESAIELVLVRSRC